MDELHTAVHRPPTGDPQVTLRRVNAGGAWPRPAGTVRRDWVRLMIQGNQSRGSMQGGAGRGRLGPGWLHGAVRFPGDGTADFTVVHW